MEYETDPSSSLYIYISILTDGMAYLPGTSEVRDCE